MLSNTEKLTDTLLYKTIAKIEDGKLFLTDGTKIYFEMSDNDCCGNAEGFWENYNDETFEGLITNVEYDYKEDDSEEEATNKLKITLYHNANPIAQADCYANDGNGGFYFSVLDVYVLDLETEELENYSILNSHATEIENTSDKYQVTHYRMTYTNSKGKERTHKFATGDKAHGITVVDDKTAKEYAEAKTNDWGVTLTDVEPFDPEIEYGLDELDTLFEAGLSSLNTTTRTI